jgi:hypothetical protein
VCTVCQHRTRNLAEPEFAAGALLTSCPNDLAQFSVRGMVDIASDEFPGDVLGLIFDRVLGDGYANVVHPLLLVCKRWQVRPTSRFRIRGFPY